MSWTPEGWLLTPYKSRAHIFTEEEAQHLIENHPQGEFLNKT